MVPDPMNFDAVFKQNKQVVLNNYSFDTSSGFIVAVRMHHASNEKLAVSVAEEHFIMLSAAPPSAAPAPLSYDLPEPDNTEMNSSQDSSIYSDLQYMMLGALFGIIGSFVYWRFTKAQEHVRHQRDAEDPNQYIRTKQPGQPRTLYDSDEEKDDLRKYHP